jgi:hypothetical protein
MPALKAQAVVMIKKLAFSDALLGKFEATRMFASLKMAR